MQEEKKKIEKGILACQKKFKQEKGILAHQKNTQNKKLRKYLGQETPISVIALSFTALCGDSAFFRRFAFCFLAFLLVHCWRWKLLIWSGWLVMAGW